MSRILVAVALAVLTAIGGGAYLAGARFERLKWEAKWSSQVAEGRAANSRLLERTSEVTDRIGQRHAEEAERVRVVYRTLYRSIPDVLTPEVDRAFPVPCGALRLHDAAAAGSAELPPSPGCADDVASDVEISRLMGTVTDNYETASQCRATVIAWQDWWAAQAQAWASP